MGLLIGGGQLSVPLIEAEGLANGMRNGSCCAVGKKILSGVCDFFSRAALVQQGGKYFEEH